MNPAGKKFLSLFLVFSSMMLSVNLDAKERRGAKLIITKKSGQKIEGELITVKPNSLLLLDKEGKDISVNVGDIKIIRVVKKFSGRRLPLIGLLIGCVGGAVFGSLYQGQSVYRTLYVIGFSFTFVILGIIVGGYVGEIIGEDKTIQIEGMTNSEIQEALEKLRKKARIRNYK